MHNRLFVLILNLSVIVVKMTTGVNPIFFCGGGSAILRVASLQPSLKRPLAAFPAASEDFSKKSREISASATSK